MSSYNLEIAFMSILLDKNGVKYCYLFDKMKPEFFGNVPIREIFICAKNMIKDKINPDCLAIAEETKEFDVMQDIMLDETLSINCEKYAQIIFDEFIEKMAKNTKTPKDIEVVNKYKEDFGYFNNNLTKINSDIDKFEAEYNDGTDTIYTLYEKLDDALGSFQGGDYIAFGGVTSAGKTMMALNLAQRACIQGKKVLYVSLEMPLKQLQNRFICMCEGLNAFKYRSRGFNAFEINKYKEGLKHLKDWDIDILTEGQLTPDKLRYYLRLSKPNFVVIDYLGLMKGEGKSLYEKVTSLSREIKLIAQEFNTVILVLVQLNRDYKERQNKRPILSDIRESGAIEQDADFVLFGYRNEDMHNTIEIIISKNRHGVSNTRTTLPVNLATQKVG